MKLMFWMGLILVIIGLFVPVAGMVGLYLLTIASGWALVDLAGKV